MDELLGLANGQVSEDQRVDERENRRIGADPERQGQNAHGDKGGAPFPGLPSISKIGEKVGHEGFFTCAVEEAREAP
jgi:hypothetical protein